MLKAISGKWFIYWFAFLFVSYYFCSNIIIKIKVRMIWWDFFKYHKIMLTKLALYLICHKNILTSIIVNKLSCFFQVFIIYFFINFSCIFYIHHVYIFILCYCFYFIFSKSYFLCNNWHVLSPLLENDNWSAIDCNAHIVRGVTGEETTVSTIVNWTDPLEDKNEAVPIMLVQAVTLSLHPLTYPTFSHHFIWNGPIW